MANPSTVPASAAGTEILRRSYAHAITNSPTKIIDGVANYTYTVLNITFYECAGDDELIYMHVNIDANAGGAPEIWLLNQSLSGNNSFVWNDKIMLAETDELIVQTGSSANVDVYCTYIEQRWA